MLIFYANAADLAEEAEEPSADTENVHLPTPLSTGLEDSTQ
jgi:hypothetical protein